mgnify:CR=1 FL=1
MGKVSSVPNRQYTDEFKVEAVRLAESVGGNEAARRLDIPDSSIWNWIRLSRKGKLKAIVGGAAPVKRSVTELEAENNCWDNAPMESFFKTLKVERVHQLRYETRAQAKLDIVNWIEGLYNQERMRSAIEYQIPAALEAHLLEA